MGEAERGLAGGAGEYDAARAEKFLLAEEIVDQERQHEQWPQQRLIVTIEPLEVAVTCDARISVVDRRDALPMRGRIVQATFAHISRFDDKMSGHRKIAEQAFADLDGGMA